MGILTSILSMAAMIGASQLIDKYNRKKLTKQDINMNELLADVNNILLMAEKKGNKLYTKILDKVNSLPTFISGSDVVQNRISEARSKLKQDMSQVEEALDSGLDNARVKRDYMTNISIDPDYLKDADQIKKANTSFINSIEDFNNKINNVEKNLNEKK